MLRLRFTQPEYIAKALLIGALCALSAPNLFAQGRIYRPTNDNAGKARVVDQKAGPKESQVSRTDSSPARLDRSRGTSVVQPGASAGSSIGRQERSAPSTKPRADNQAANTYRPAARTTPAYQPNTSAGSSFGRQERAVPSTMPKADNQAANTYRPAARTTPAYQPNTSAGTSFGRQERAAPSTKPRVDVQAAKTYAPANSNRPSERSNTGSSNYRNVGNTRDTAGSRPRNAPRPAIDNRPRDNSSGARVYTPNVSQPRTYRPPTQRGGFYYYDSRPNYRPSHYGYWDFDHRDVGFSRRSIYFHFGYFPYILTSRIFVEPYVVVGYYGAPVVFGGDGYYLERRGNVGLDEALSDIRDGWIDGRLDLVENHVDAGRRIAVLLDGRYDYSVDSEDYIQMTSDGIDQFRTVSFTWQNVRARTNGDFTAFARHDYIDPSGSTKTVFVSYTLHRIGGDYVIVEVGSSASPLF